jgi:hypothetical protein
MSCDDCSTNNACRGDHGSFDESRLSNTNYGDASCEPDSDWRIVHTVNPASGSTETYDEIEGSNKYVYLNSFFSNTPEAKITTECQRRLGPFRADPKSVEYYVRHSYGEDQYEYEFDDPRPNGDGDYDDFIVNTALDIVAGVSSNPLVGVGTSVIKNYIGSMSQSSVEHRNYDPDPTRDIIWWDLDYATGEDFPTTPCSTTGVRFKIQPNVNSGDHDVATWARYTFGYTEYRDGYECACDYNALTSTIKTTDWVYNPVTFTFNG